MIYMSIDNIKEMNVNGMSLGMHTVSHDHLELMTYDEQLIEVTKQKNNFTKYAISNNYNFFSYPYGTYDDNTIEILKNNNVDFAFTTNNEEYTMNNTPYLIPRLDCNVIV